MRTFAALAIPAALPSAAASTSQRRGLCERRRSRRVVVLAAQSPFRASVTAGFQHRLAAIAQEASQASAVMAGALDRPGNVSGKARRELGTWPTPESVIGDLVAALEAAAQGRAGAEAEASAGQRREHGQERRCRPPYEMAREQDRALRPRGPD